MLAAVRTASRIAPRAVPAARFAPMRAPMMMGFVRFNSTNTLNQSSVPFTHSGKPTVRYTEEHEWIAVHEDGTAFVGITKHAADALGDATFVEVPEAGTAVEQGDSIGSVESVKSASELYSPVAGEVVEGNSEVADTPSLVNEDPMGAAWFAKIKLNDQGEIDSLMTLEAYEQHLKESE
uniref:Glycine cleavage system H protein n=1 Tax=Blastobotrys adeninivorans TaxID=409370 RepID=A0A060T971_BLAAD